MSGPAPKPAHLRQRTNQKAGSATIQALASPKVPTLPNPDKRKWHKLTKGWWKRVWASAMASQYLPTDVDGLARLALLVDAYYQKPGTTLLAEIRLQESRFGLSPLDRSRLQWEIRRAEDVEPTRPRAKRPTTDPRALLMAVK